MTQSPAAPARGLENVVITSTKLSSIDGTAGRLSYVGYPIEQLAAQASFEEVCYLLWHGELPTQQQLDVFKAKLANERALGETELALARAIPQRGHGMDALRSFVSLLGQLEDQPDHLSLEEVERVGLRLAAKMPVLMAAWARARNGEEPVIADPLLGQAANFLWMLKGEQPSEVMVQAFNTYLVLLAEHGLNASTFGARVAIGAQADVYCAVTAAVATLKGVLHGGANQKAMETFLEIGSPERAAPYIDQLVQKRGRLMGVGHRIYKVEDPRARPLREQVEALSAATGSQGAAIADAVGDVIATHEFFTQRHLAPNVEFYSAPLLYALGLPLDLFTCAFAFSRIAGWIGHIREQIEDNRLIRPKADYNGPARREFVPLSER